MNNSVVSYTIYFVFLLLGRCLVYSDTRWGLKIHLCFTSELGEILSYNGFSADGTDYPRI